MRAKGGSNGEISQIADELLVVVLDEYEFRLECFTQEAAGKFRLFYVVDVIE